MARGLCYGPKIGYIFFLSCLLAKQIIAKSSNNTSYPNLSCEDILKHNLSGHSNYMGKDLKCNFVKKKCQDLEGIIPYFEIYWCSIEGVESKPLQTFSRVSFFIGLVFVIVLLFILLGTTADCYFSPVLEQICKDMGLPPRFAGVTFLALGNGAPDVSSTVAAIEKGDYRLSLGALTGAGMFVTCVVAGLVMLKGNGVKSRGALVRDVMAYLLTLMVMLIVFHRAEVTTATPGIWLVMYGAFVLTVLSADMYHRKIYLPRIESSQRIIQADEEPWVSNSGGQEEEEGDSDSIELHQKKKSRVNVADEKGRLDNYQLRSLAALSESKSGAARLESIVKQLPPDLLESVREDGSDDSMDDENDDQLGAALIGRGDPGNGNTEDKEGFPMGDEDEDDALVPSAPRHLFSKSERTLSLRARFFHDIRKWIQEYRELSVLSKIQSSMELPFTILRTCLIPMTSEQDYSRPFLLIACTLMPLWFLYYLGDYSVGQGLGTMNGLGALIALAGGLVLATLVFIFSTDSSPPKYGLGSTLALIGFVVAATWIDKIADELVAALQFLGIIAKIDSTILGLTVLAWGNSIGDLSTNIAMARRGLGNMAITACFAGPVFNMLIGLSLGYELYFAKNDTSPYEVKLYTKIFLGAICIMINCIGVIVVGLSRIGGRNHLPGYYGYCSIVLYCVYLALSFVVVLGFLPKCCI